MRRAQVSYDVGDQTGEIDIVHLFHIEQVLMHHREAKELAAINKRQCTHKADCIADALDFDEGVFVVAEFAFAVAITNVVKNDGDVTKRGKAGAVA